MQRTHTVQYPQPTGSTGSTGRWQYSGAGVGVGAGVIVSVGVGAGAGPGAGVGTVNRVCVGVSVRLGGTVDAAGEVAGPEGEQAAPRRQGEEGRYSRSPPFRLFCFFRSSQCVLYMYV